MDLEELPDSRERTRAPVLWLSCEGQIDVWEMFSDNSYLSAILDRQGLSVAVPVDLRTKNSESFFTTAVARAFGRSSKIRIPSSSWCPRRQLPKTRNRRKSYGNSAVCAWPWQKIKSVVVNIFSWHQIQERSVWKSFWKKKHCRWTLVRGRTPKWIFHNLCNLLQPLEFVPESREHQPNGKSEQFLETAYPRQK